MRALRNLWTRTTDLLTGSAARATAVQRIYVSGTRALPVGQIGVLGSPGPSGGGWLKWFGAERRSSSVEMGLDQCWKVAEPVVSWEVFTLWKILGRRCASSGSRTHSEV